MGGRPEEVTRLCWQQQATHSSQSKGCKEKKKGAIPTVQKRGGERPNPKAMLGRINQLLPSGPVPIFFFPLSHPPAMHSTPEASISSTCEMVPAAGLVQARYTAVPNQVQSQWTAACTWQRSAQGSSGSSGTDGRRVVGDGGGGQVGSVGWQSILD